MEELANPIISPNDDREYRAIRLTKNKLKVLLVCDKTAEKAAAAMSVRVGSFSDPEHIPGLAHFCEHMLFMGTEKYPDENEYSKYLNEHGGHSNAFTAGEDTNYFFNVAAEHLEGALDRFAQFFTTPLFTEGATDRELRAVDSDPWRMRQLIKSTSTSPHPYHKYGTGNLDTLLHTPKEKGINVRDELLAFHSKYYSANLMNLVIVAPSYAAPASLEELQEMAEKLFSGIPNSDLEEPKFEGDPVAEEDLRKIIRCVPVKETRSVEMTFFLPDQRPHYRSKPSCIVSHVLGHEGKNSLLSLLKEKGWANGIVSGSGEVGTDFASFCVGIDFTEEGWGHWEEAVELTFQYLKLLRDGGEDMWKWISEEVIRTFEMQFRFMEKGSPDSWAQSLASWMHSYPMADVIAAPFRVTDFEPDLIRSVLELLTPERMRILLTAPENEKQCTSKEQWYGTMYSMEDVSKEFMERLVNVKPSEEVQMILPNEFIPSDFALKPVEEELKNPVEILSNDIWRVFHKQDAKFKVPKLNVIMEIHTPVAYESPYAAVYTKLFSNLLSDTLNEYAYDAEIAGLKYSLDGTSIGFNLMVGGYHHKLPLLLKQIVETMFGFTINPARFDHVKSKVARDYRNFMFEQAHQHAMFQVGLIQQQPRWTYEQYISIIDGVQIEDVQSFIPRLLSRAYILALVHGNATKEDALAIVDDVQSALSVKPLLDGEHPHRRIVVLPTEKPTIYSRQHPDAEHFNAAVEVYFQFGDELDTKRRVVLDLMSQILAEPCFNVLRTKEQLGYIVFSGKMRDYTGIEGFMFLVQSSSKNAPYLTSRVDNFIENHCKDILESVTDEEFQHHVESLIVKKETKDKNLGEETSRHWVEVAKHLYRFDKIAEEVRVLREEVNKSDVVSLFEDYIARGGAKRRRLVVEVLGNIQNEEQQGGDATGSAGEGEGEPAGAEGEDEIALSSVDAEEHSEIDNIFAFKLSRELYPLPNPAKEYSRA